MKGNTGRDETDQVSTEFDSIFDTTFYNKTKVRNNRVRSAYLVCKILRLSKGRRMRKIRRRRPASTSVLHIIHPILQEEQASI